MKKSQRAVSPFYEKGTPGFVLDGCAEIGHYQAASDVGLMAHKAGFDAPTNNLILSSVGSPNEKIIRVPVGFRVFALAIAKTFRGSCSRNTLENPMSGAEIDAAFNLCGGQIWDNHPGEIDFRDHLTRTATIATVFARCLKEEYAKAYPGNGLTKNKLHAFLTTTNFTHMDLIAAAAKRAKRILNEILLGSDRAMPMFAIRVPAVPGVDISRAIGGVLNQTPVVPFSPESVQEICEMFQRANGVNAVCEAFAKVKPAVKAASEATKKPTATSVLTSAKETMEERGKQYDSPEGERSFDKVAQAYSAVSGKQLAGSDVALILALVKIVRDQTGKNPHEDSLVDLVAYAALYFEQRMGESKNA